MRRVLCPFKEWVQLLVWKLIFSPTQRFFSVANCLLVRQEVEAKSSTVTYSDPTYYCDKVCFGVIEKFLTIDDKECPEKTLHVAFFYVDSWEIDTYKHLLISDYVSVTGHQRLVAVRISDIAMMHVLWCVHFTSSILSVLERKRYQLMCWCACL